MLTEQRHEIILQLLNEKGSITVSELKKLLNSSESTIRRDLNTLDEEGYLTKVFGGAVLKETVFSSAELSVSQKINVNADEKQSIARYAAKLIVPDDFIYIDAGTTTEYMIDFLTEKRATYVTNAVTHARKLAVAGFKVILIGGELKGITEAVVGNQAIITLEKMNFNKGFFGFFCYNDEIAYNCLDELNKLFPNFRKNYPRFHIVGVDALSTMANGLVDISSVDLNLETQCDRAIEYMLQRLEGVKRERVKEIVPVKFHQRVLF